MRKFLLVVIILFTGYGYFNYQNSSTLGGEQYSISELSADNTDAIIAEAFSNHKSDLQASGEGVIIKLLPDDRSGSRHQKFIIKLASGQKLLIVHNIDLAPRLTSIRVGDSIQFNGEYEWNEKGGVLHWTHRDPNDAHTAGWLKYQGKTYQ
jgi:Protein of unknown function (DUF3465)